MANCNELGLEAAREELVTLREDYLKALLKEDDKVVAEIRLTIDTLEDHIAALEEDDLLSDLDF